MISSPSIITFLPIFEKESNIGKGSLSSQMPEKLEREVSLKADKFTSYALEKWETSPKVWGGQNEDLGPDFEWFESGLDKTSVLSDDENSEPYLSKRALEELDTEVCSVATPIKMISVQLHSEDTFPTSGTHSPNFELTDLED